ncbi:MAG TPA: pyridoxamine 5'-phosphate oxidase [Candidatus Baltobacteraceae bacterium]|nr:pyridoxamine 5'-phosphate oxidase [Candidatus Baltobacteraceae bacterium]
MSIETSRDPYESPPLRESDLSDDPIVQLRRWLDDAYAVPALGEPNAMTLATASPQGRVSARVVLLRGLDASGLSFYTSYFSRKAAELAVNPYAAATFFWAQLHRQVRVEGTVAQLSEDESDAYFATRPRGHQLSAWASEQSAMLDRRETLSERMQHFDERFAGEDVPRPHSWGGYVLRPDYVEFWQGQGSRLHDRLCYARVNSGWSIRRLQP